MQAGGFLFKSANEAKPVADTFHKNGLNTAILDYRYFPYQTEYAGEDGLRAIRYLRYYAEVFGIDKEHIGIGGFSAGGILTSMVCTRFDKGKADCTDPIEQVSSRPDAVFQMYGSFRRNLKNGYTGEIPFISFDYPDAKAAAEQDFVLQLPLDAPPMFMAQTDGDNPHMVLEMAKAYADRGIEHEYHMFHGGIHGGGLYNGDDEDSPDFPHTAHWVELCCEWFELMGF